MIAAAVGVAAVVAVIAFIALSGSSSNDANASQSATSTIATSTSAASTTTTTTTKPPTTTTTQAPTTTTDPPVVLRIAHTIYVAVFQERNADGTLTGFEVDLVDELTDRMSVEAEWIETDLAELYYGTDIGEFDLAIGGLVVLDVTLASLRFSDPYFNRQHGLMVDPLVASHVTSFAGLISGDAVAVDRSTRSAEWAEADLAPRGVKVVEFGGASDVSDALSSGEVDAYVSSAAYPGAAAGRYSNRELIDATPTGQVVAFGVDPEQPDLRLALNAHLAAMIDDGTYQLIYNRWFQDTSASVAP
jgi:ABC-type amino acid transport substrate-binding protein